MPPMKIQPVDVDVHKLREPVQTESSKPVLKSRLRRLFDKQFPSVLRTSTAEKTNAVEVQHNSSKDGGADFDPSSVCLAKMVQSFMEDSNDKQPSAARNGRNRCNCFNGNGNDTSDDEFDVFGGFGETLTSGSSGGDVTDVLKSLNICASVSERNLLADTAKIVDKQSKGHKRKDDLRKFVTDRLSALGYDSSICKSRWEKCSSYPAGEYEYIDVIVDGERLLIDIDFRSEFEIARSTGTYKTILQSLPHIFVGKADRLGQIVSVVSEAAKQSLKKKGMHIPPWRKTDYMKAKWLSPYSRAVQPPSLPSVQIDTGVLPTECIEDLEEDKVSTESDCGELELIFGEKATMALEADRGDESPGHHPDMYEEKDTEKTETEESKLLTAPTWQPPAIRPKSVDRGKIVTGLASLLKEKL